MEVKLDLSMAATMVGQWGEKMAQQQVAAMDDYWVAEKGLQWAGSSAGKMVGTLVTQTARAMAATPGLKLAGPMDVVVVVRKVVRRASKCFWKLGGSSVGSWVRLKGLQRVGEMVGM